MNKCACGGAQGPRPTMYLDQPYLYGFSDVRTLIASGVNAPRGSSP